PVLNEFDVIIPVSAVIAKSLREIGYLHSIVLWSHHAADQPSVQGLKDPGERSLYAGIALVSNWHAQNYVSTFNINPITIKVMRNAISSAFLNRTPDSRWIKEGAPPVLGYSSTPYRGLDILLLSFAAIRKMLPDTTLRVFSSMQIYGSDTEDRYSSLYELANTLPGVTYAGALPQARLAEEMSKIDIWSYPCTFVETSCISAIEAMASGCLLVSTTLGALPETTAGFAHLTELPPGSAGAMATHFANHVIKVATDFKADPKAAEIAIAKQIAYANENYSWKTRAKEWISWLEQII
ncbi:MAG: glycosyltransferase family 4 protein, partial [Bdellovibrionales bacterium]